MPNQNWHKDRAGKYVRFRRVDGTLHVDLVISIDGQWMFSTGVKGGEKIGDKTGYKTRMAATSALDSFIENQVKPEPEFKDEHHGENTECDGCHGSGKYYGKGYMENGVFKGFVGDCFRCGGKGFQTDEDRKRNWGYDNFHRKIEA